MKIFKKTILLISLCFVIAIGLGAYIYLGAKTTNPNEYARIGDIPTPLGYTREKGDEGAFSAYLRSLPLKPKGSKVMLYTGGRARLQNLAYAVLDMPLLSNAEQCADCCIRLRAEYLYANAMYDRIQFRDVNNNMLRYKGTRSREQFNRYLRHVYDVASTYSLNRFLPKRELSKMQPGDVFVFAAQDRPHFKYGHAVMVADVAVDEKGEKVFLLVEGNTPAREMHVMRNWRNPLLSPWFRLDTESEDVGLSCYEYRSDELRHW